jgi:hypothetical protein
MVEHSVVGHHAEVRGEFQGRASPEAAEPGVAIGAEAGKRLLSEVVREIRRVALQGTADRRDDVRTGEPGDSFQSLSPLVSIQRR